MKNVNVKDSFFIAPTDENEVLATCLNIKSKYSTGHDGISNVLLKNIIPSIVKPLTHIFNSSFACGVFPDWYKIAKIIPVFKSGNTYSITNYRPI